MPTADELCEQADSALARRNLADAVKLLELAIASNSRHAAAHDKLAGLVFLSKDYERAFELFKRAAMLDPKNTGALVNAGAACNKKKDFNEAAKTLRSALSKDRRCPEAYYNLGIAQRGLNQLSMAVSAYKEAIRLNPKFIEAYTNLGNVLLEMKNHSQAISNFRAALEIDPNFQKARQGLLKAEESSFQSKNAISPFGRLVDMDEVERRNQTVENVIELTPQERFDDRDFVHRFAKESELSAIELLNQIKEELAPAVLRLSRLAKEEKHGRVWAAELAEYQASVRRFRLRLEHLKEKTSAIREHEVQMQKISRTD